MAKCFYCGKKVEGAGKQVMPGKVPGAVKIPIVETFNHPKHKDPLERVIGYEWEAQGEYPIPVAHEDCPK